MTAFRLIGKQGQDRHLDPEAETAKIPTTMAEKIFNFNNDQHRSDAVNPSKEFLTVDEAAVFLNISKSQLYKYMSRRQIPYYKPNGKLCYLKRSELEEWVFSTRVATDRELNQKAMGYCLKPRK